MTRGAVLALAKHAEPSVPDDVQAVPRVALPKEELPSLEPEVLQLGEELLARLLIEIPQQLAREQVPVRRRSHVPNLTSLVTAGRGRAGAPRLGAVATRCRGAEPR